MQDLLDFLNGIYPLSEPLRERLKVVVKRRKLAKHDYLLRAGQINREIHFIIKGLLWCYYERNERQMVSWFMAEGDTVVSVQSFYNQVPGKQYIQALEDCELYYISYQELEELYHSFPWFNFIGRELTKRYLIFFEAQAMALRGATAEEVYQYLLETQPKMIQRVPGKCLAAYLGVSESMVSKIRGKR